MPYGELKFAIGERSSRRTSSRRTLVRGGWFSSRERILWRTVRQFAAEYGRTRANPGELRRTPANVRRTPANVRRSSAECRCWRTDGEFARSSREFARVRPSSREFARVRGERQFAGYTATHGRWQCGSGKTIVSYKLLHPLTNYFFAPCSMQGLISYISS